MTKREFLKYFSIFSVPTGGIGSWISPAMPDVVMNRLLTIDTKPLPAAQLNQLLALSHEAPISQGFFDYYWQRVPKEHPYNLSSIPKFSTDFENSTHIGSHAQLYWGLYRLYIDSLLYFGNVRTAFRQLRELNEEGISAFFRRRRFDTSHMLQRGSPLCIGQISRDDRYLIAEQACKSYSSETALKKLLFEAYTKEMQSGDSPVSIRSLLEGNKPSILKDRQFEIEFSADEYLDHKIDSLEELKERVAAVEARFLKARKIATENTKMYLSAVNELDAYVATSMRNRNDFRTMAKICDEIFSSPILAKFNLRYFDPTLSAANSHEDKGLIECLMVKCAKVLVYCAGDRDSYGKDAEAAMALSLGKPVIFLCDKEQRKMFYRDIHPLSRLIQFHTGIAVGAIVTDNLNDVPELLHRLFENCMQYRIEQKSRGGYLLLKEALTDSVVRLQTDDKLLSETFWNHYHSIQHPSSWS